MKKTTIILISLLIFSMIILSACGEKYVCADGSVKDAKELCDYNKVASIRDRDAKINAENYIKGYLLNTDYRYTYVNEVLTKGDYEVKFIVSAKDNSETYESIILVDGVTGNPECREGCNFMNTIVGDNQTEI